MTFLPRVRWPSDGNAESQFAKRLRYATPTLRKIYHIKIGWKLNTARVKVINTRVSRGFSIVVKQNTRISPYSWLAVSAMLVVKCGLTQNNMLYFYCGRQPAWASNIVWSVPKRLVESHELEIKLLTYLQNVSLEKSKFEETIVPFQGSLFLSLGTWGVGIKPEKYHAVS